MGRLQNRELLSVLVKAYNTTLTDYYYFPEVIFAGRQRIEREAFELLRSQGLIQQVRHDSFGRFYTLTSKGEQMIYELLMARAHTKRKNATPAAVQASFF